MLISVCFFYAILFFSSAFIVCLSIYFFPSFGAIVAQMIIDYSDRALLASFIFLAISIWLFFHFHFKYKRTCLTFGIKPHITEIDKDLVQEAVHNVLKKKMKGVKSIVEIDSDQKLKIIAYISKVDSKIIPSIEKELKEALFTYLSYNQEIMFSVVEGFK